MPPLSIDMAGWGVQGGEALAPRAPRAVHCIIFFNGTPVHLQSASFEADTVTGHTDDPLYKVLHRVYRVAENDDVAALHVAIRQQRSPEAIVAVHHFVHQQVV